MWQESLVSESCRPTWRFRLMILGMYYTSNATKPWISAFKMKWLLKKQELCLNTKIERHLLIIYDLIIQIYAKWWHWQLGGEKLRFVWIKRLELVYLTSMSVTINWLWTSKWNHSSKLRVVPQMMFTFTIIDLIIQIQIVVLLQISQMRGEK